MVLSCWGVKRAFFYPWIVIHVALQSWWTAILTNLHQVKKIWMLFKKVSLVNCLLLKLNRKLRKMLLIPKRELNPKPSDLRWDALTIELPELRWQRQDYDVYWFVRACTYILLHITYYILHITHYILHIYMCVCSLFTLSVSCVSVYEYNVFVKTVYM